jgi:hypothetical protein
MHLYLFADGLALSLLGWGHILDGTSPYILQNGTFTVKGNNAHFFMISKN